jgi:hypothetical protein
MSTCTNPKLGALLHAYELGALSEEELERFEVHLLSCDYCFAQVRDFEQAATLMRTDIGAKKLVQEAVHKLDSLPESGRKRTIRILWPKVPLYLKPGFIYILLLVLCYPAYLGIKYVFNQQEKIRPVQVVSLSEHRGIAEDVFHISSGYDGLISFMLEDEVIGKDWNITIESEDGSEIYHLDAFITSEEYGVVQLFFPLSTMKPGRYRLTVTLPEADYSKTYPFFRIKK